MKLGINYLTECTFFFKSLPEIKRDLEEMKKYRFEAIRLTGDNLGWLLQIAEEAKKTGLEIWLCPRFAHNEPMLSKEGYLQKVREFAKEAEARDIEVFLVGNELSLELKDFAKIQGYQKRCEKWKRFQKEFQERKIIFKDYLLLLAKISKEYFSRKISYAAGFWELDTIVQNKFDIVGANLYLYKDFDKNKYLHVLKTLKKINKPIAITEFGFQTHNKAFELGPAWFLRKKYSCKYNEEIQAKFLEKNFKLLQKSGVKIAFIHQWSEIDDEGFGLVRSNGTPKKALSLFQKLRP